MTQTYQRYYSASDTQIVISDLDELRSLTLDLATGIGYNESAPSVPIYGLKNTLPLFFVRGNSIVSGFIGIATRYEDYLKKAILYVNGLEESVKDNKEEKIATSFDEVINILENRKKTLEETSKSILDYQIAFKIKIILSVEGVYDTYQGITINNCIITGRSLMISSDGENPVSDGFSFIASNIE